MDKPTPSIYSNHIPPLRQRNLEWAHGAILDIWSRIPVPMGNIVAPGADLSELDPQLFVSKRFNEVDVEQPAIFNRQPLIYLTPEARYYYMGTYLVMLLSCGDNAGKWTLGADHAVNTLRRLLQNPSECAKVNATDARLPALLEWLDSCTI